ncbi:MAG: hypothetical protein HQK54_02895 [Oligoflexales bacterium]|nr:hypothetical protein [Oligoflexales bacterium]
MKILKPILILLAIFSGSLSGYAITCVQPDWDNDLCNLPNLPGDRCANAKFFRTYCEPGTVGCEAVGGCVGNTPIYHWYAITNEMGEPKYKCRCGCFAAETVFTRESGEKVTGTEIIGIYGKEQSAQFTVSSLDAFDSGNFTDRLINAVTYGPEKDSALFIKTKAGRTIMVSKAHPLVIGDQNGKLIAMKAAEEVKEGEYLIAKDGYADEIATIEKKTYTGKMVNFNVASDNANHHIVEANGILTGDQGWQDQLNANTSRMMWRNDILKYLAAKKGAN